MLRSNEFQFSIESAAFRACPSCIGTRNPFEKKDPGIDTSEDTAAKRYDAKDSAANASDSPEFKASCPMRVRNNSKQQYPSALTFVWVVAVSSANAVIGSDVV